MAGVPRILRRFVQIAKSEGIPSTLVETLVYLARQPPARYFFAYAEYLRFLAGRPRQWRKRLEILRRYRAVDRAVLCYHREGELLRIADVILRVADSTEGDIIECGCFMGGATCKLSIVAKLTGRRVVVCDSFAGLPTPREDEQAHFAEGDMSVQIEQVRDNVARLGEPDSLDIVPGWFHETLPLLGNRRFIAVFEDADVYDSVLCCVKNLWPALQPGCRMFTHDVPYPAAIRAYTDAAFWLEEFGEAPPRFVRVGRGLRLSTRNLGYVRKPLLPKIDAAVPRITSMS